MDVTALSSVGKLGAAASPSTSTPAQAPNGGPSFTEMLGQIISDGVNTIQGGESAAIQGLSGGGAPPFKVVEAVMGAQRTLQEGLSIRDKVVSAYQELSRMAI
jgi:flagellar hook-basal body complex protein FliE